jgi:predicted nuclease of restriction endonuclease-like (RecB) superfamily
MHEIVPDGYSEFLKDLKVRIVQAQRRAILSVNHELVLLYWDIGRDILKRQSEQGWGTQVIDRLARDLRRGFPEMKGFSPRNLKYMRAFAGAYPDEEFVQQLAAQIPWFHHCVLLDKVKNETEREWYLHKTIEEGWSRNMLVIQIESGLYGRQSSAITNFDATLLPLQSDLARQTLKNPYVFDFLTIEDKVTERRLEQGLLANIRQFLIELGVGFAFVGNQFHLEVGGSDFYVDLLFYHLKLRAFVVIDVKMGAFKPEHAGKLNFYLSAVDEQLRHAEDQPSIGIVICKTHSRTVAEYALRDISKPLGVSDFEITRQLPEELRRDLPTVDQIEEEL